MRPYSHYKDSGIQWLGKVPSHWETIKLKFTSNIVSGSTPDTNKVEYWDGDIIWLTPVDFGEENQKYVFDSNRRITKSGLEDIGNRLTPFNSVIFSSRAPIGLVVIMHNSLKGTPCVQCKLTPCFVVGNGLGIGDGCMVENSF